VVDLNQLLCQNQLKVVDLNQLKVVDLNYPLKVVELNYPLKGGLTKPDQGGKIHKKK
jgi:hypothetical protein